ncbi:hypothetical protein ACH5RR_009500 [Cinchona calisaya]|uniref:PB1-like domain-containing protein n=1 Tax=Cinchona calisaya TaxID=153742 RepID=A0ABD3AIF5_9GENT
MNLMKKLQELCTLSDVKGCIIIYSQDADQLDTWPPSPSDAESVISKFNEMSDWEQHRNMVNQENFIKKRIKKLKEQLKKLQIKNHEEKVTNMLCQFIDDDSTFISVKLNHGGYFIKSPKRLNMEREVDYFNFIDPGTLTVDELKEITGRIKYPKPIRLYYLVPGSNLKDGIIGVEHERDVKEMLNHLPKRRLLELYLIAANDDSPSEREWTSSDKEEHVIGVGSSKQWKYATECVVEHDYDNFEKGSKYDADYSSSDDDERSYNKL